MAKLDREVSRFVCAAKKVGGLEVVSKLLGKMDEISINVVYVDRLLLIQELETIKKDLSKRQREKN